MDLLGGYDSSNSESENPKKAKDNEEAPELKPDVKPVARRADRRFLQAAPSVSAITAGRGLNQGSGSTSLTVYAGGGASSAAQNKTNNNKGALVLMNNPTKSTLFAPVYGPLTDPNATNNQQGRGQHETNVAFEEATFQEQRTKFQRTGRAAAPDAQGTEVVRTTLGYSKHRLQEFAKVDEQRRKRQRPTNDKKKEALVHGSDDEVEHGIWAPPSAEERWAADNALSDIARGGVESLAPEQLAEREYLKERDRQLGKQEEEKEQESAVDRLVERKMAHLLPPKLGADDQPMEATTQFHAKGQEFDYKGQSWMAPPAGLASIANSEEDLEMDHHKCYVPKKCFRRFDAGGKGVHRIRLFPKTGHLLLSAGLDGVCKVWSLEQKQLMRSYTGHSAAVRDVQFNHSGSRFVSASFDRYLRLWNTETGEVLQTLTNRKVPYVVKFFPLDDNLFVVGCSDNKIVTYDCTTGEITQEYNHHLAPVNAIVFAEDKGMKMITSSDDKKLLVWEWDTPVPIKYISDPTMHSMPCMTMHPSFQYFCGQSLDNHIAVFQASNRFALQRKKKFSGHIVAGYACEMDFSPDGQYLASGDGNGKLCFWDFKRTRMMQKYRAHDKGPAICVAWHPLEPSVVFSCGWDGVIKMWE